MKTVALNRSGYRIRPGQIVDVTELSSQEKLFRVRFADDAAFDFDPGQFVEVSLFGVGESPISICSSPTDDNRIELCVRRAGRLTGALHRLEPGAEIGIRGPFGVGFPVVLMEGNNVLLIAGGLGLAPLRSLVHYIIDNRRDFGKVDILLGCRDPASMLFSDELSAWSKRIDLNFCCSVDHASPEWAGNIGLITALIPGVDLNPYKTYAVSCGPPVMYRHVVAELMKKGIPAAHIYLSLERHMKCGLGKCGHCQIQGLYCCRDGPVFCLDRIRHIEEAF